MIKLNNLIPKKDNYHDFYLVRLIENLTGKSFHGFTLLAILSLGLGLLAGTCAFFVQVLVQVFLSTESEMSSIIVHAVFMSLELCLTICFTYCLFNVYHQWLERRWGEKRHIVEVSILCIVIITCLSYLFVLTEDLTDKLTNGLSSKSTTSFDKPVVHTKQGAKSKYIDENINKNSETSSDINVDKNANLPN